MFSFSAIMKEKKMEKRTLTISENIIFLLHKFKDLRNLVIFACLIFIFLLPSCSQKQPLSEYLNIAVLLLLLTPS